jgi:hypothetical protein
MKRKKKPDNSNIIALLMLLVAITICAAINHFNIQLKSKQIKPAALYIRGESPVDNLRTSDCQFTYILPKEPAEEEWYVWLPDGTKDGARIWFDKKEGRIKFEGNTDIAADQLFYYFKKEVDQYIKEHQVSSTQLWTPNPESEGPQWIGVDASSWTFHEKYYLTSPEYIPNVLGIKEASIFAGYVWISTGIKTTNDWVLMPDQWRNK